MKKILYIFFIIQLSLSISQAQSGWFWQNPLPQGNYLSDLKMINPSTGFCVNGYNILKTTNGGNNWFFQYTGFNSYNSSLSMVDLNVGYVILDSTTVIKTTNSGNNWFQVSNVGRIMYPSIYFINYNTGFVLGSAYYTNRTHLIRTTNGGVNWATIISDTINTIHNIHFPSQITGYAVGSRAPTSYHLTLLKTTNSGLTWDSIQNNIFLDARCVFFVNNNEGYIGGYGSSINNVYKTTNGGLNWDQINYPIYDIVMDIYFLNQNTGFVATGYGVLKTTNAGGNWTASEIYTVCGNNAVYEIEFTDGNNGIGVGSGGLIIKSSNGGINWMKNSYGEDILFDDVKFFDANTGFAGGEYGRLLKTTNGGVNWNTIQFNSDNEFSSIAFVDRNIWYIGSFAPGKIFKTTNTGLTWDTQYINQYGITRLDFINATTGFGICKYQTFFKTTNGGQNWIVSNNLNYGQNWALDFIDANTGYAGGTKTSKTTDGGNTWNPISFGIDYYSSDIQFINHNTGFISGTVNDYGYHGIIMKTTNAGVNWRSIEVTNSPLDDIYFVNDRVGFTLRGNAVFKSTNGGINWFQIRTCNYSNSASVSYFVDTLTGYIVGSTGMIIKTTNGGGVPIGITPISSAIPKSFTLFQNYPNPFNPSTKIKFEIGPPLNPLLGKEGTGVVSLKVYDILGREVATLVNEQLQPGTYEIEWNGEQYSSGIYFYKLSTGDFTLTKKMVLLK